MLSNIPSGNLPRTISIWYRTNVFSSGFAGIFAYGDNPSLQTFGFYIGANGNQIFQASGSNRNFGGNYPQNVWRHVVLTYNGVNVSLYINGEFIGSQDYNLNTVNAAPGFRLGGNGVIIDVDDLKIFNYVLSFEDINSLYNNNTLSTTQIENLKSVTLYPNPTSNIFEVKADAIIQKVEVYNLSGQLVHRSNQLENNIAHLSAGIYLVKVTDENNQVSNQKIIKN